MAFGAGGKTLAKALQEWERKKAAVVDHANPKLSSISGSTTVYRVFRSETSATLRAGGKRVSFGENAAQACQQREGNQGCRCGEKGRRSGTSAPKVVSVEDRSFLSMVYTPSPRVGTVSI